MKFHSLLPCLIAASILWAAVPAGAQDAFDPDLGEQQLTALAELLGGDTVTEEGVAETQRRSLRLRNQASTCVTTGESRVEELRANRALLGDASADDPAEIIEQRTTYDVEIRRAEARVGACRLVVLQAARLLDDASELQRSLSRRRLLQQGDNGLRALGGALISPVQSARDARTALLGNGRLDSLGGLTWFLLFVVSVTTAVAGVVVNRRIIAWSDQQRGRSGGPTLRVSLIRHVGRHAPFWLPGVALSASLATIAGAADPGLMLFRLATGLVLFGLGRAAIDWFTGPFAPGGPYLEKIELRDSARHRFIAVLAGVTLGWLLFGSTWLSTLPQGGALAVRALLTLLVGTALLWLMRIGRVVPTMRGRILPVRFVVGAAGLAAVVTELAGYRNLSNYFLSGGLATFGGGLLLWTTIWALRQGVRATVSGTSPLSYRLRGALGIRQEETSAELGWLYILLSVALWLAFIAFLGYVWDTTGNAIPAMADLLARGTDVGGKRLVPMNILVGLAAFGIIIAVTAWLKARLNKRWLRDMGMDRHAREALVTVSGYAGFGMALLAGLTLAGVSFAGLALVFGALSVGIGFGLQNIVNNFVSGLILLFERPIKAGDFVTVGMVEGIVKQVRMRATEIETLDRQNVLVPNSELVSTQVTNWVLRDPHGRLVLPIGVAYGSDTALVRDLLEGLAAEHPDVLTTGRTPAPRALFMGFGDSALDFELRVWVRQIEKRFAVISDLNFAIDAAFRENGIVVPFPQRDLHVYRTATDPDGDTGATFGDDAGSTPADESGSTPADNADNADGTPDPDRAG